MAAALDMEAVMEIEHGFGKGSKKPVDKAAPKRFLSAFFQWANKMRPSVKKDNPDATIGELGKILGDMWGKTKAADRASYEAKAEKDKAAYHAKVEKYKKTSGYKKFQLTLHAWKIHETKKPYPRDLNAPKRPLTAYMLYTGSVRADILKESPDLSATEVLTEQSVWWKALSAKDRKPWIEKAEAEKEKYQKKLARYIKTSDYQTWAAGRDKYKQDMKEKRNKLMGIKKRARSVSKRKPAKKQKRSRTPKRRSRTPKRRSRTPKRRSRTPKPSRRRRSSRRSSKRRARTPKAPKRSRRSSRRRSARRSRTPKRSARRSSTPKSSKSSASRSSSRRTSRSRSRKSRRSRSSRRRSSGRRSKRAVRRKAKKSADSGME